MNKFFYKVKYVKKEDLIAIFKFIVSIPVAILIKFYMSITKKELWLICETKNEARDNGYCLFKYIREEYPNKKVYYAIDKKSEDYKKVSELGNIIQYGSFTHWIYYLIAKKNISSHKGGKPNAAVCYLLEVYGMLKNTRVFLQHGVIMNDAEWLHYKNTKMRLFVCGAYPEYVYVENKFGYPKDNVKYLGLCRFDNLHDININKKQIVFMPTWRNWIGLPTNNSYKYEDISDFTKTEYFLKCNELINNKELIKLLEDNDIKMYFFPHRNMQGFIEKFKTSSNNVIVASMKNYDIQDILKDSALMITDYSSVSVDFGYMKKPVIYYQFDFEKFRAGHCEEGYFSYERDGFGPVCYNPNDIIINVEKYIKNNFKIEKCYKDRHELFFKLYDNNNCGRTFEAIENI